jgi:hypothetical protein
VTETNGSGPLQRAPGSRLSRRSRLLIGAAAAIVIGAVLVAPIVILTGGQGPGTCTLALTYKDGTYVARAIVPAGIVQGVAIGVGVTSGCGTTPANIGVRSLLGVKPAAAVGIATDSSSLYVRRGLCAAAVPSKLLACLKRE